MPKGCRGRLSLGQILLSAPVYAVGMRDNGYSKRARAAREAQAELHAAFAEVVDRNDTADPRTQRWNTAIAMFHAACARVYVGALREVHEGTARVSEIGTRDILDFLEADPMFFRSGYMKEQLLTELKRRGLDPGEIARLLTITLAFVQHSRRRRELRYYCLVAARVATPDFRAALEALELGEDADVRLRANWVLAALDGKWTSIRHAARRSWESNPDERMIPR